MVTLHIAIILCCDCCSSLLYGVNFVKQVTDHLVKKLVSADKGGDRVVQILEGLSILCSCKGVPIKVNQSKSLCSLA